MNKKVLAIVVIVVIVAVGAALALSHKKSTTSGTSVSTHTTATGTNFTINANDDSADVTTLNVAKGKKITVTFKVDENGVYHGGLEFRSGVVNSGPIKPGASKTVTFTANQSFNFTPFWYQSNVQKGYLIVVKVASDSVE